MSRSWDVLRKDLRLGPRSPLVLWALLMPVLLTLLIRGVFGDLFAGEPSLGLVDEGRSEVAGILADLEGIEVRSFDSRDSLRSEVGHGRLDAGLVLPPGFDEAVRRGEQPELVAWMAGESLPSDRAVLLVAVLDALRALTDAEPAVEVEIVMLGEATLPLDLRLLPLLVLYAVAIPGGMVPAASLVEEKERGTLHAVLASPASIGEVLLAKGVLGIVLAIVAGLVTLVLNDAFGAEPLVVLVAVLIGAVMMAEVGLLFGSWAQDSNTLFAAWKAGGMLLFLPAIFFIWPGLPTWPALLLPTYYFLQPVYAVSVEGASLGEVGWYLVVGAVICLVLVPVVAGVGRWLETRVATGGAMTKASSQL